ncbi:unnamed protein product [Acanthosepion pharaonis]|uniref:Uncharacterized protein n=1 Tax=Acanthosepion pharaonis TaxID=158019 RepID=A0A812BY32_ACAPH|nr:unnamed protein product [Sepia pharaonis]
MPALKLLQYPALLQHPAHSCSIRLTPAVSRIPASSGSLLQLPAHSCSIQLTPAASSTSTCTYCGRWGHFTSACFRRLNDGNRQRETNCPPRTRTNRRSVNRIENDQRNPRSSGSDIEYVFHTAGARNLPPPIEMDTPANRSSSLFLGLLNQIKEQLDEQSQTLHKINSTVQKLEAENALYKQELMTAHTNIHQLSSLLDNERRKSHLSLERHFIQMQEMLCTEMKRMSHEINELKLKCCQQNFPATPSSTASSSFQQSKRLSQNATYLRPQNDVYEDALKFYQKVKKRPTTAASTDFQNPLYSSSNVQQMSTKCNSAPCPQPSVPEPQVMSPLNSIQKMLHPRQSRKKIHDKTSRTDASRSKMSNTSSDQDLDSSPNQAITISSTQNLTLQVDEEDLHSDDSNFDLLDSRSFGKSEDGLESSSSEDLALEWLWLDQKKNPLKKKKESNIVISQQQKGDNP